MSKKRQPKKKAKIDKKTDAKEDIAAKVKKALEIQGFPLEVSVYRSFLRNDWDTELEAQFRNIPPNPGKEAREWWKMLARRAHEYDVRFIDVKAEKHVKGGRSKYSLGEIGLVIECKSHQTIPWVFYEEEKYFDKHLDLHGFSIGERSSFSNRPGILVAPDSMKGSIRSTSHHTGRNHPKVAQAGHIVPLSRKSKQRDSLYEACMSVIAALEYYFAMNSSMDYRGLRKAKEGSSLYKYWRWYPVIVFGGRMFTIEFDDDDEFTPLETKYIQLKFETDVREYLIDIVQRDYLGGFISILETEVSKLRIIL